MTNCSHLSRPRGSFSDFNKRLLIFHIITYSLSCTVRYFKTIYYLRQKVTTNWYLWNCILTELWWEFHVCNSNCRILGVIATNKLTWLRITELFKKRDPCSPQMYTTCSEYSLGIGVDQNGSHCTVDISKCISRKEQLSYLIQMKSQFNLIYFPWLHLIIRQRRFKKCIGAEQAAAMFDLFRSCWSHTLHSKKTHSAIHRNYTWLYQIHGSFITKILRIIFTPGAHN